MNFSLLNIPLSDSSCKVFSMNLTAESHCCFSLTDQSSRAVSWITRWEVKNRAVTYYTETNSRTVSNRHLLVFSFPISWPTKNQVRLEAEMSKLSRDDTLHVRLAEKFGKPKERCQNQSHKAIHQFWVKKNVEDWFVSKHTSSLPGCQWLLTAIRDFVYTHQTVRIWVLQTNGCGHLYRSSAPTSKHQFVPSNNITEVD